MRSLNEVESGRWCSVVWMIGQIGAWISREFHIDLDDSIQMIHNLGQNGVIVNVGGRRLALDPSAAWAIKVNLMA